MFEIFNLNYLNQQILPQNGGFHGEAALFSKNCLQRHEEHKSQLELPPRPWLYDEYTMSSIGFSFQPILRGGLAGVC